MKNIEEAPPGFQAELKSLQERGILDNPKIKAAFLKLAKEMKENPPGPFSDTVKIVDTSKPDDIRSFPDKVKADKFMASTPATGKWEPYVPVKADQ